jgi:hypothetical protein
MASSRRKDRFYKLHAAAARSNTSNFKQGQISSSNGWAAPGFFAKEKSGLVKILPRTQGQKSGFL